MLTQARLKELLHYDPETGIFTRLIALSNKIKIGKVMNSASHNGYIKISVDSIDYLSHRLAWLYVYGKFPTNMIDHINGVRNDNRINNLRNATKKQNAENQKKAARNNKSSGLLGVTLHRRLNKYQAQITVNGKYRHIGVYKTPTEAHQAYLKAKRELHEFCTI